MSNHSRPTGKQLSYLRALALQTGTTFTPPASKAQAGREIERLWARLRRHGRHRETSGQPARPVGYAPAVRQGEVAGYGSSARWRARAPASPGATSSPARPARRESSDRPRPAERLLGSYLTSLGATRAVLAVDAPAGRLLIDRAAHSGADARLIARLDLDEPAANAELLARMYLADASRGRCRPVCAGDLHTLAVDEDPPPRPAGTPLVSPAGARFELAVMAECGDRRALRWTISCAGSDRLPVTLRHVVGTLQDYNPMVALTRAALAERRPAAQLSLTALQIELAALLQGRSLLNRRLRELVHGAVARGELSATMIALRCGRHTASGSADTSWLARRIGARPETGMPRPTPWVSHAVLALIAREGLGIAPREAELAID